MNAVRGPQNLANCPFHILREDPLSATASIAHCVKCVTGQNAVLQEQSEEFQQTAFLTVIEASALYDPDHPSGASFITFIKSKVCCALWQHRRELQKYQPCGDVATEEATETETFNPLVADLGAAACSAVSLEDSVIDDLETQRFRDALPVLFRRLTAPEKKPSDGNTSTMQPVPRSQPHSASRAGASANSSNAHSQKSNRHTPHTPIPCPHESNPVFRVSTPKTARKPTD